MINLKAYTAPSGFNVITHHLLFIESGMRLDKFRSKNPELDQVWGPAVVDKLLAYDPTFNLETGEIGDFTKQLFTLVAKEPAIASQLSQDENLTVLEQFHEIVESWARLQPMAKARGISTDIQGYDSVTQFVSNLYPLLDEVSLSKKESLAKSGAETVYEDDLYKIIKINSHDASTYYGRGTNWCTTASGSDKEFNKYVSGGLVYILDKTGAEYGTTGVKRKWAIVFQKDQIVDNAQTNFNATLAGPSGVEVFEQTPFLKSLPSGALNAIIAVAGQLGWYYTTSKLVKIAQDELNAREGS